MSGLLWLVVGWLMVRGQRSEVNDCVGRQSVVRKEDFDVFATHRAHFSALVKDGHGEVSRGVVAVPPVALMCTANEC